MIRFIIFTFISLLSINAYALREARSLPMDNRLQVITYHPNDVFKFIGHYNYQSSIEFEEGEKINTVSMGNTDSWQIVPSGNRLFLKPIANDATTNMTVISSKRIYHFELHAEEVDSELGINDDRLVFVVKFVYPKSNTSSILRFPKKTGPDLTKPENFNFKYSISGSDFTSPTQIFDDGKFTYFKFENQNAVIPAFYIVNSDSTESLVNYRVLNDFIVVESVNSMFTLRYGNDVTCVFNELKPFKKLLKKEG